MEEKNKEYSFDSVDLLLYVWNKKWTLIILTGLAAVISVIASLLIDDKYKSEVVVFPVMSSSISQDLLSYNVSKKNLMNLGEDEEVEQLLQILNSDDIRDRIIEKYDLMNHYGIKPSEKYRVTALHQEFGSNISYTPTKFMSVKISVLDKDAQMAADIANDITNLIDTVKINMQRERALEALALVEKEYYTLNHEIYVLEDSLRKIRNLGVFDFDSQSEVLSAAHAQAILEGNANAIKQLQKKLDVLAEYGGISESIKVFLEFEKEQLSRLKTKHSEAIVEATQHLPNKFVVNKAVKAEKKSYPVRSIIVIISMLSTFILSLLLLVIVDAIRSRIKAIQEKL